MRCIRPATARTLRGAARQIATADRPLSAMQIQKAGVAAGRVVQHAGNPGPGAPPAIAASISVPKMLP